MYKLNGAKMFFDIADGQAVVINFTTGMYYGTSTLGSAILDNLINGVSPEAIIQEVKKQKDCPSDFENKLNEFIDDLLKKEIIVRGESVKKDAQISQKAYEDGFSFTIDEYAEIQDLLMADPIHEVDIEQGWPILKDDE